MGRFEFTLKSPAILFFFFFCNIVIDVRTSWSPVIGKRLLFLFAGLYLCWLTQHGWNVNCTLRFLVETLMMDCANMRLVLWKNNKDHADVKHDGISRNKMWFLSSPQFGVLCSHHSLGRRPTKQLASMGIPAVLSNKSLPPPSLLLLSSSLALCPRERGGQVYFLHGGPCKVVARPLPCCCWCIRWGSLKRHQWDSFITAALSLIVAVPGDAMVSILDKMR